MYHHGTGTPAGLVTDLVCNTVTSNIFLASVNLKFLKPRSPAPFGPARDASADCLGTGSHGASLEFAYVCAEGASGDPSNWGSLCFRLSSVSGQGTKCESGHLKASVLYTLRWRALSTIIDKTDKTVP